MRLISRCTCGKVTLGVVSRPIGRWVCHCFFCQGFTGLPASDDCVFWAKSVSGAHQTAIVYSKQRAFGAFQRGRCAFCGEAVAGVLDAFAGETFMFIPSKSLDGEEPLPKITAHAFYHRRLADALDASPKYSGYWPSQLATLQFLGRAWLKGIWK